MRSPLRCLPVFGLILVLAGLVPAEDKKPNRKLPDLQPAPILSVDQIFSFPKRVTLTDDQQANLAALKKEYAPRITELQKKRSAIVTPERQKAAIDARIKALNEGRNSKEAQAAYDRALKLTDEEKEHLNNAILAIRRLSTEAHAKVEALLTDEQKETLKPQPKTGNPKDKPKE